MALCQCRSAILSTCYYKWLEHCRDLDTVKEGIGLRSFGQKDPLLEYKKEAFGMFKELLDAINSEAIALIWKAIPEIQADPARVQQAQKEKGKVEMDKAQTRHDDSTNSGVRGSRENGGREDEIGRASCRGR